MKDNLEEYIKNNRAEFDKATPNLKTWAAIDQNLDKKKLPKRRLGGWQIFRMTAAVAAILVIGIFIGLYISKTNGAIADHSEEMELPAEMVEMEAFYQTKLKEKKTQLASYNYNPVVNQDLEELNEFLNELKEELMDAPASKKEQIMGAMINNYQTRIDLLERVLERIQTSKPTKQLKSKKDETIDI